MQRQVLDEVRGARLTAFENRASNLPPDYQRRRAFEKGHNEKYPNSNSLLGGGVPLSSAHSASQEFQGAVKSILGMAG